ncbi:hypothetical protein WMY93_008846 [Mugilogobius chulae]|uniref:Uncharacterized protein n=1 Tax=Mugilogobius chulae TaxID=88201 RepID=A0AAW0PNF3_9GOBI
MKHTVPVAPRPKRTYPAPKPPKEVSDERLAGVCQKDQGESTTSPKKGYYSAYKHEDHSHLLQLSKRKDLSSLNTTQQQTSPVCQPETSSDLPPHSTDSTAPLSWPEHFPVRRVEYSYNMPADKEERMSPTTNHHHIPRSPVRKVSLKCRLSNDKEEGMSPTTNHHHIARSPVRKVSLKRRRSNDEEEEIRLPVSERHHTDYSPLEKVLKKRRLSSYRED